MTAETKSISRYEKSQTVKRNQIKCALNMTDDMLDKILSVSPSVRAGECSLQDNEIVYGGTVWFNVVYTAEEIDRAEAGAKFSFKSRSDGEADRCSAKYHIEDLSVKTDGGMLFADCTLVTELSLEKEIVTDYLTGINAFCKKKAFTHSTENRFKKTFTLDDEFTEKQIKRALFNDATAIVTAAKAEDDCVVVDGEAILNVCLLPF